MARNQLENSWRSTSYPRQKLTFWRDDVISDDQHPKMEKLRLEINCARHKPKSKSKFRRFANSELWNISEYQWCLKKPQPCISSSATHQEEKKTHIVERSQSKQKDPPVLALEGRRNQRKYLQLSAIIFGNYRSSVVYYLRIALAKNKPRIDNLVSSNISPIKSFNLFRIYWF